MSEEKLEKLNQPKSSENLLSEDKEVITVLTTATAEDCCAAAIRGQTHTIKQQRDTISGLAPIARALEKENEVLKQQLNYATSFREEAYRTCA